MMDQSNRETVAFDMEGTLSAGVTWRGIRDYLVAHGQKDLFRQFIRSQILRLPLYYLGLINRQKFREEWLRQLLRLFSGMSRDAFDEVSEWVVAHELWPQRRANVIEELQAHRAAGRRVVVVSGLIEPMLVRFAGRLDCVSIGTPLLYDGDVFTGETDGPFLTGQLKAARLGPFTDPSGRIEAAYGDTYGDVAMLEMSRQPTAVAPEARLARVALANGWRILSDD